MKVFNLFASIAFTTLSIRSAYGSSACAEVSYLYYSQSCCDQADTTCYNIVESTDNATMGNLVGLKRENGEACADDDVVTYVDDTGTGSHGLACVGTGSTAPTPAGGESTAPTPAGGDVDCAVTWSACADGSRTSTVVDAQSGTGAACPASPEVCTGAIGATCTAPAHCDSATCDSNLCAAAPAAAFQLFDDTDANWPNYSDKLTTAQECEDLLDDADLLAALVAIKPDFEWGGDQYNSAFSSVAAAAARQYAPLGCAVRTTGYLYYNPGPDALTTNLNWNTGSRLPILLP